MMKSDGCFGRAYFQKVHQIDNPERRAILYQDLLFVRSKKANIKRILDVGCGLGEFLGFCDQEGMSTYGLEISHFAISQALKNTQAKLVQLDITKKKWPFADSFFDAVTAFDVLEHTKFSDFIISQAYRVLKKEGIFVITTPNGDLEHSPIRRKFLPYDPTHINVQGEKFWKGYLEKAGFHQIESKGCLFFGFPPSPQLRSKLRRWGIKTEVKPFFSPLKGLCATLYLVSFK